MSVLLAAELPDPGSADFIAVAAVVGAFAGAIRARLSGASWEEAERIAFRYGIYATGGGLVTYLFGLATGLY